jgi:hypothetical protein
MPGPCSPPASPAGVSSRRTRSNTPRSPRRPGAAALVSATLPETLSARAQIGRTAFDAKCAICHVDNAAGREGAGPPLVHRIHEPSHHADESFQLAVVQGVRVHHWTFGNMAPVAGLARGDAIIAHVRELQRTNGIF